MYVKMCNFIIFWQKFLLMYAVFVKQKISDFGWIKNNCLNSKIYFHSIFSHEYVIVLRVPTDMAFFTYGNLTTLASINSAFRDTMKFFVRFTSSNFTWLKFCILMIYKLLIWNTRPHKQWLCNWIYLSCWEIPN